MILSIARYDSAAGAPPRHIESSAKLTAGENRSASLNATIERIPSSLQVRIIRIAISPRLAMSTDFMIALIYGRKVVLLESHSTFISLRTYIYSHI